MTAQGKHYTTKHPPNDIDNLLRRSVESAARSGGWLLRFVSASQQAIRLSKKFRHSSDLDVCAHNGRLGKEQHHGIVCK